MVLIELDEGFLVPLDLRIICPLLLVSHKRSSIACIVQLQRQLLRLKLRQVAAGALSCQLGPQLLKKLVLPPCIATLVSVTLLCLRWHHLLEISGLLLQGTSCFLQVRLLLTQRFLLASGLQRLLLQFRHVRI